MAINYFSQLGFDQLGNKAMQAAQGVQGIRANAQAMDINQQNVERQRKLDEQSAQQQVLQQRQQRAANGVMMFNGALQSNDLAAANRFAQEYQDVLDEFGIDYPTLQGALSSPETAEQLKPYVQQAVQMIGGAEQYAKYSAEQAKPAELSEIEKFKKLEAQRSQIEAEQGPEAAARFAAMAKLSKSPVSTVNVNMPQDKEIAKLDAEAFTQYNEGAKSARKQINSIGILKTLSDRAVSGTGANLLLPAGKLLNQLTGIEVDGLTESEVFQQLSNTLVLDKSQQMSGALSNADMTFLQQTVPQLNNTKEGRRLSLEIAERLAKREIDIQKQAVDFRRKAKAEGKEFDDAEFQVYLQEWAEKNPLTEGLKQELPKAPQAAIDYLKANPQTIQQFKAKYGYAPEGFE